MASGRGDTRILGCYINCKQERTKEEPTEEVYGTAAVTQSQLLPPMLQHPSLMARLLWTTASHVSSPYFPKWGRVPSRLMSFLQHSERHPEGMLPHLHSSLRSSLRPPSLIVLQVLAPARSSDHSR